MFFLTIMYALLPALVVQASPLESRQHSRPFTTYCMADRHLVGPNTGATNYLLHEVKKACEIGGQKLGPGETKVFPMNHPNLQIYFCNQRKAVSDRCEVGIYQHADALITEKCGPDVAGYTQYYIEDKLDLTVGKDQVGFKAF